MFSPPMFTGKCDWYVSKYSGTTLVFSMQKKKSLKGDFTYLTYYPVDQFNNVRKRDVTTMISCFLGII